MSRQPRRDIVVRWEGNPLITPEDIPFPCNTVFNAAATRMGAEYILLLRVEDLEGRSVFALGPSDDGYHFCLNDEPVMVPATEGGFAIYERKGIEDPRITFLEDTYYIVYTAVSEYGPRLALARTDDFKTFERVALISETKPIVALIRITASTAMPSVQSLRANDNAVAPSNSTTTHRTTIVGGIPASGNSSPGRQTQPSPVRAS